MKRHIASLILLVVAATSFINNAIAAPTIISPVYTTTGILVSEGMTFSNTNWRGVIFWFVVAGLVYWWEKTRIKVRRKK